MVSKKSLQEKKEKKLEYQRKYHKTENGKQSNRKYKQSEKGKEDRRKYEQTENRKSYRQKYYQEVVYFSQATNQNELAYKEVKKSTFKESLNRRLHWLGRVFYPYGSK